LAERVFVLGLELSVDGEFLSALHLLPSQGIEFVSFNLSG
jgi:hypothetical protein